MNIKNIIAVVFFAMASMVAAAQGNANATANDTTAKGNEVYNLYQALVARPRNPFGSCTHATYDVEQGYVKSIEVTHCAGLEIRLGGVGNFISWKTDEGKTGNHSQFGGQLALQYTYAREGWCIAPFAGVTYSKLTDVDMEDLKAPAMELKVEAGGRLFPHGRVSVDLGGSYGYSRATSQKTFSDGHTTTMAAPCRHLGAFIRPMFVVGYVKTHRVSEGINITVKHPVRVGFTAEITFSKVMRPDGEYTTQEGRHFVEPAGWDKVKDVRFGVNVSYGF